MRLIALAGFAGVLLSGSGGALAADNPHAAFVHPPSSALKASAARSAAALVDINTATKAELKTLPGIADAEAERIIAARPYLSKAKLVADKVLSYESYQALAGRIIAAQPPAPAQRKR